MFKQKHEKLNNFKNQFSIKDLENLSGIKAHTIRIWEKRYNILTPSRTNSNIRFYDLKNFQKLLNVNLLYNNGYKISKIAQLSETELLKTVREQISKDNSNSHFIDSLKLAMLNFDLTIFEKTYNNMLLQLSFRDVYINVFIPLLNQIGLLWQSESITPAHEHFIAHLIKQKIHTNIERVQQTKPILKDKVFVLFLPDNEIHELGLLYIQYELLIKGYHTIYLGQSVPHKNLNSIQEIYTNITYISYFTVAPVEAETIEYLEKINTDILSETNNDLWVLGRNIQQLEEKDLAPTIFLFKDISDLLNKL